MFTTLAELNVIRHVTVLKNLAKTITVFNSKCFYQLYVWLSDVGVVYSDQRLGAAHFKRWSK